MGLLPLGTQGTETVTYKLSVPYVNLDLAEMNIKSSTAYTVDNTVNDKHSTKFINIYGTSDSESKEESIFSDSDAGAGARIKRWLLLSSSW
jgi:hypothetical protein